MTACSHKWQIWPETDGQEQRCAACGEYRKTPPAFPQCSTVVAKSLFAFKVGGKGRAITFKPSDRLWVTNSQLDQRTRGIVMIGREGRHSVSGGYAFTFEQAAQLFTIHKAI